MLDKGVWVQGFLGFRVEALRFRLGIASGQQDCQHELRKVQGLGWVKGV